MREIRTLQIYYDFLDLRKRMNRGCIILAPVEERIFQQVC